MRPIFDQFGNILGVFSRQNTLLGTFERTSSRRDLSKGAVNVLQPGIALVATISAARAARISESTRDVAKYSENILIFNVMSHSKIQDFGSARQRRGGMGATTASEERTMGL